MSVKHLKILYEKYQHKLAVLASKTIYVEDFPAEVRIETINSCNSTCSFCPMNIYSPETKDRKVVKMDESLFKKIIAELISVKYEGMIKFYTENEPLLDKRIVEFVQYANDNLPNLKGIQIDTNGLLLTESLGIPIIEASRHDKDILASDLDYIHDLLQIKKDYCFDPYNPLSIAECLGNYLSHRQKKEKNHKIKIQVFSGKEFINKLFSFI